MPRPTEAVISLSAWRHNLHTLRQRAGDARVWAVVKADAYGHGLPAAVTALSSADGLALIEFGGAERLRTLGWERPVLMLEGPFDRQDVAHARHRQLTLVIHDEAQMAWLAADAAADRPLSVWVKFDSGMQRLGFPVTALSSIWTRLQAIPGVHVAGLMTHCANADQPAGTHAPRALLMAGSRDLQQAGLDVPSRSLANSAALFAEGGQRGEWVRPGIALYGATPFAQRSARDLGLQAVMTLRSRLLAIRTLAAGDTVGYGGLFRADRPMRIGTVACGYADGYPRVATTGTPVAVDGVRTRLLGRVSMDMLCIDLEPVPGVTLDSVVELWGANVAVDEVAPWAQTVGYELLCAVAPRVQRVVH